MIGTFTQPRGPEKLIHNEQGTVIGRIQPGVDAHGNSVFVTASARPERSDTLTTMTEGAGRFWLWSLDERHGGEAMRRR